MGHRSTENKKCSSFNHILLLLSLLPFMHAMVVTNAAWRSCWGWWPMILPETSPSTCPIQTNCMCLDWANKQISHQIVSKSDCIISWLTFYFAWNCTRCWRRTNTTQKHTLKHCPSCLAQTNKLSCYMRVQQNWPPRLLHAFMEEIVFTPHWICSHMHHWPPLSAAWTIGSLEILKAIWVQLNLYFELFTGDQITQHAFGL